MFTRERVLIIGILLFLLITIAVLLRVHRVDRPTDSFVHLKYGGVRDSLDIAELSPAQLLEVEIEQGESLEVYTLEYILTRSGYDFTDHGYENVYFSSADGQRLVVSREEVEAGKVFLKPEAPPLLTLRLVFPEARFRNRWLKDIRLIEFDQIRELPEQEESF
jgi:hypothetical protein